MKNFMLFLLIVAAVSCKKDPPTPPDAPEPQSPYDAHSAPYTGQEGKWPDCTGGQITHEYPEGYRYTDPSVNPNNPYEFCFLRIRNQGQSPTDCDLMVYNFETNKVRLLKPHVNAAGDWSSKNWIIFTVNGAYSTEIWKIKGTGDSLTRLVYESSPQKPKWSTDGRKFLYYCGVCNVMKIADENGIFIKYIARSMEDYGWKSPSELLYFSLQNNSTQQDLCTYNIETDVVTVINTGVYQINTWDYRAADNLLLRSANNLYQYELATTMKSYKLIKGYFENQYKQGYNRCPNFVKDKIISQVEISVPLITENCKMSTISHISIMNADGSNERHVIIPEN